VTQRSWWKLWVLALAFGLMPAASPGQQAAQQEIPDAPSAKRPASQFPPPAPRVNTSPLPEDDKSAAEPPAGPSSEEAPVPAAPSPEVKTVPAGSVPQEPGSPRDQLFTLSKVVDFVLVPVTVKDEDGRLVNGLLPKDFSVFENGTQQQLKFFTSDPFPLSAAIIFDLSMPDVAVRKLNQTFPALQGAFSQFDEVAVYTYSTAVRRVTEFGGVNEKLTAMLNQMKTQTGRNSGPPVLGGPLGSGPMVNGLPLESGVPPVLTPPKESHTLNDALLAAAMDLSKQPRDRRKIIFIVSDGREYGSKAGYTDTLKVLLSNEVTVYALAVDSAAIPGYKKLAQYKLPGLARGNILPKYAGATGGEVFTEFSREAMERVYSRATGDARNQYTLGYNTRTGPGGGYREIEVRVFRPKVKVAAKYGYYPLPAPVK